MSKKHTWKTVCTIFKIAFRLWNSVRLPTQKPFLPNLYTIPIDKCLNQQNLALLFKIKQNINQIIYFI